jgi:putative FmdB family regulatory protein
MPIYEFKCLKCNECFEFLTVGAQDAVETRCPHCQSDEFERVLSCTSYAMGPGSDAGSKVKAQTRSCSGGSCSTLEISGPSR